MSYWFIDIKTQKKQMKTTAVYCANYVQLLSVFTMLACFVMFCLL